MTPTAQSIDGINGTYSVCGRCGRRYGADFKKTMGMWQGECAICNERVVVANALHDFGLTDAEVRRIHEQATR
jgi:DNA-directed RNA polymerase subunit RPC12/RpoP